VTNYTIDRFFSSCSKGTTKLLKQAWKDGDQLAAGKVPVDGIPVVLIMAGWGLKQDVELVDDFDKLIERFHENAGKGMQHPDLFLAGSICIMRERGQDVTVGGYEAVGIPDIYDILLGEE